MSVDGYYWAGRECLCETPEGDRECYCADSGARCSCEDCTRAGEIYLAEAGYDNNGGVWL